MPETWWEYVGRISGNAPNQQIAVAAGCDPSQVSRWRKGSNPDAARVVHFARHYNRPPVEALITAGYLNEDEAAGIAQLTMSAREKSSDSLASEIGGLVAELRRRIPGDEGEDWRQGWVGNSPIPPEPSLQKNTTVRRREG